MAQEHINPGVSLAGAVDLESLKHEVKAKPGQAGGAPEAGGYVIDSTEGTFQSLIETSATFPILLMLWVPTDDRMFPMARALAKTVNALNGKIQFSRIDADTYPSIAQALQVQGAPALFALIAGRPMPILQGVPSDDELTQVCDAIIPKLIQVAAQAGVTGTAPFTGKAPAEDDESSDTASQIPPEHEEAHALAQQGDYAGAAAAYAQVLESNPHDVLAAAERAKALLLARSGKADVREVRENAAAHPDDVDAQLAVADIDMIGGQIDDAFTRLLDYLSSGHRDQLDAVRLRLVEYFAIPEPADERLRRARRRLAGLMY
jgi:putative thioredoxin